MARLGLVRALGRALELPALPYCLGFRFLSILAKPNTACAWTTQAAASWSGIAGSITRRRLLRSVLARVGDNVSVSYGTIFSKTTAEIGDNVYIGAYCNLGDVRIGCNTHIADMVSIPSGRHQHGSGTSRIPASDSACGFTTVRIGSDCWIGSGSVVMADIGDGTIVGAGSVVTKPIPANVVAAGNPARVIAQRPEDDPQTRGANAQQVRARDVIQD